MADEKPTELYMIVLTGGGDTTVKIIDKETYDWLDSPRPEMTNCHAYDKAVPEAIRQRTYKYHMDQDAGWPDRDDETDESEGAYPHVTSGSCENDRALWVAALTVNGVYLDFDSVSEATNWFVENSVKCVESWDGCIY